MPAYLVGQTVVGGALESGDLDRGKVADLNAERALVIWGSGYSEWVSLSDLDRLAKEEREDREKLQAEPHLDESPTGPYALAVLAEFQATFPAVKMEIENHVGSWCLALGAGLELYATPFWEDEGGVAVEVSKDGEVLRCEVEPYSYTGDVRADALAYARIVFSSLASVAGCM